MRRWSLTMSMLVVGWWLSHVPADAQGNVGDPCDLSHTVVMVHPPKCPTCDWKWPKHTEVYLKKQVRDCVGSECQATTLEYDVVWFGPYKKKKKTQVIERIKVTYPLGTLKDCNNDGTVDCCAGTFNATVTPTAEAKACNPSP